MISQTTKEQKYLILDMHCTILPDTPTFLMFKRQQISIFSSKYEDCGVSKRPTANKNTRSHSTREFHSLVHIGSPFRRTNITKYSCIFWCCVGIEPRDFTLWEVCRSSCLVKSLQSIPTDTSVQISKPVLMVLIATASLLQKRDNICVL